MDIQTDSVVSEDQMKAAIQFGIDISYLRDTKKYIIAFLKRLLLHGDKVGKNLNPAMAQHWQEVLSSLEETNRKLLNIQSRSLVFALFCPTDKSLQQLQDEKWRIGLQEKMDILLNVFGMYQIIFE